MASRVIGRKRPDPAARPRTAAPENSEAAIWGRLIDPRGDDLSEDAARSFLRMTFREEDRKRAHDLTIRNRDDALTPPERAELENYCRVGRVLDLMLSKARLTLKRLSPADRMDEALPQLVRQRADEACEYCGLRRASSSLPFEIDHFVARKHGGKGAVPNLARRHRWGWHFARDGPTLVGRTAIGRTTISVLRINDPIAVAHRRSLIDETGEPA